MEILFLGTGTSTGIPQIGCDCEVCLSSDFKDKRLRSSVILKKDGHNILIDCGPDIRQQLINYNINSISEVLLTHEHYDHIGGIDDLRPLGEMNIYAETRVHNAIRRIMPYCFGEDKYPGVPQINLHEINEDSFSIDTIKIQPIRILHAKLPILGFRIDNFAYITDVKFIADEEIRRLKNLDVLVLGSLQKTEHLSHFSFNEALQAAEMIGAKETYFIHLGHKMGLHESVEMELPPHIYLSHDGLKIKF